MLFLWKFYFSPYILLSVIFKLKYKCKSLYKVDQTNLHGALQKGKQSWIINEAILLIVLSYIRIIIYTQGTLLLNIDIHYGILVAIKAIATTKMFLALSGSIFGNCEI